jgi:tellurium resistance protein TerD
MNFFDNSNNNQSAGAAPLNLNKNDVLDLTKKVPSLKNVIVGAGWDVNELGGDNFDLDISAFLLDNSGRVTNPSTQVVFFNAMTQQGIYLEGDNLTGAGEGDDERINVCLDDIPSNIKEIIFNVNIFEATKKRQTFGMIKNSYIRLLDKDNGEKEICRYELKRDASQSTAVTFASLYRNDNGGWSFKAIGDGLVVADLNQLLLRYM